MHIAAVCCLNRCCAICSGLSHALAAVNKYAVWATNEEGTTVGPVYSVTVRPVASAELLHAISFKQCCMANGSCWLPLPWQPTVLLSNDTFCGHIWTFSAKAYNQVGASGTARFTSKPFTADPCNGG